MPKSPPPLFLARRAYRRRRMMDAARLLPLAGCVLMMLPALWHPATTPEPDTARGTVYLFGIWALLILAALALSKGLSAAMREEDEGDPGQGGQTGGASVRRGMGSSMMRTTSSRASLLRKYSV